MLVQELNHGLVEVVWELPLCKVSAELLTKKGIVYNSPYMHVHLYL